MHRGALWLLAIMTFLATRRTLCWTWTTLTTPRIRAGRLVLGSTERFVGSKNIKIHRRSDSLITARYLSSSAGSPPSTTGTPYGRGMDQQAMMETDRLIAVDECDRLLDSSRHLSKKDGHRFAEATPRGVLHRAFSFFLFDEQGRMLLTQRAASKITFPNVWTNTCCSHPLRGMIPDEVDDPSQDYPEFAGMKHAARRKLLHELGIDPVHIPLTDIVFLKRFHYWAADTITYGSDSPPWGEHEVDYILFFQTNQTVPIHANPDEVSEYRFVGLDELQRMMERPGGLWSPWFRGIMDRGGWDWWRDLPNSLAGTHTSKDIVYFDPPQEHWASYNLESHSRTTTGVWKATSSSSSSFSSSSSALPR